ncbi:histone H1 [Carabus blaptoides fortunei]
MELVYVQFIASFLDQRSARVRVGVELSASFTPAAGVPQGSVLSPLLYALYCVGIPQPTEHGDGLAQYADDTVYFSSARNSYIATEQLQALVVRLEEWMRAWRVKPNPTKTQLIIRSCIYCNREYGIQVAMAGKKGTRKDKKTDRPKPTHPTTAVMVNNAIQKLKERGGSSLQAIKKYISATYKIDSEKFSPFIKKYLKASGAAGTLVQTKRKGALVINSFEQY